MLRRCLSASFVNLLLPLLTGALIVLGGLTLAWQVGDHLLRADARAAATDWLRFLEQNVGDLDALLAGEPPGPSDRTFFRLARDLGGVFHYALSDPAGRLRFVAGPGGRLMLPARGPDPAGRPVVDLRSGDSPGQPDFFAAVHLPLLRHGDFAGTVEVGVDLTGPAARYWSVFGYASWGLCALLALAAALPGGLVWRKVRDLRRAEARIHHIKHHDPLTGLPDRRLLRERLTVAVDGSKAGFALLCFDLDRFKEINETLGHGVGDEVLKETARRLRAVVRPQDMVARLGGDAFAVVLREMGDVAAARLLAARMLDRLIQPIEIEANLVVDAGCRLGIACHPVHGHQPDELFRNACIALHDAKLAGSGRIRVFSDGIVERVATRRSLENDLRRALERDAFILHFQPVVALAGLRLKGFEALIRWDHPERGLLGPEEFLPLAEELGLILPIGERVIAMACGIAADWPADCRVAVNLSATQFEGAPLDQLIERHLATSGLPARRLDLEVTESVLIKDSLRTADALMGLKEQGVQLSLDDFGTGYASLNYLARYPFDRIKIDRSFVARLQNGPDGLAMVSAVIGLGRRLALEVTAEGIESYEQLSMLQRERCPEGQGCLFSPPVEGAEVPAMIEQIRRASAA